jgi:hypothetical protein
MMVSVLFWEYSLEDATVSREPLNSGDRRGNEEVGRPGLVTTTIIALFEKR